MRPGPKGDEGPLLFIFDNCSLDTDRRELRQGAELVAVEPQVFDVIVHLVRNRDRVVSREDLLASVWGGRIVSESTLSSRINAARSAIGDDGIQQRLIRTIARKGFRFVGEVREGESSPRSPEPSDAPEALSSVRQGPERRQLTIMACRLDGLADLARHLDPEDLRDAMDARLACIRRVVEDHKGFVARHMPDGTVAYFGYPEAHENDAERAVRAALSITGAIAGLNVEHAGGELQASVSLATGVVIVGHSNGLDAKMQEAAIGETPLLATRLLTMAAPGSVVISATTRNLIGGLFECLAVDAACVNEQDGPSEAFHVLRESIVRSRFEALQRSARSPFVAREEELEFLERRWQQASQGSGRVVLIVGEPGIGKSRLIQAFQDGLALEHQAQLTFHCSPHHRDSALHPIVGRLMEAAGIRPDDNPEIRLAKFEELISRSSADPGHDLPLLAPLLSIPVGDRYPVPRLTAQRLKQSTLTALVGVVTHLAAAQPTLITFEDVHWIDPTSLELLSLIVGRAPDLKVLVIATHRPEFIPPWANHHHVSTVLLGRLSHQEGQALINTVTKYRAISSELVAQIVARADGIPLFIEELTKSVLESGLVSRRNGLLELASLPANANIPSTLHASLLARLDRSAVGKEVAQIAAAIGREFHYGLLSAVAQLRQADLEKGLGRLVDTELVFQRGTPPDATYVFKHALVQEAAYALLLRSRRRQIHGQIARALEEHCPDIVAIQPEIVAHHYTEAGDSEHAIEYLRKAAEHSLVRSAYVEAARHLSQAIELLSAMPQVPATLRKELEVRIKLGPVLIVVKGINSVDVEATYLRARELVDGLGETLYRFLALWGLWFVNYSRGQYATASEAGEQLLDTAQSTDDKGQCLEAHHALWATRSAMGDAVAAVGHMEHGIALYDRNQHAAQASLYGGHDPCACCHYHLAINMWILGYPDRSLAALQQALCQAESLKHPMTMIITLWYAAWVYYQRGDRPSMRASLARLLDLAGEHAISSMPHVSHVLLEANVQCSREKLGELHQTLQATAGGNSWQRVFCQCVLAELFGQMGHADDGLAVLASISAGDRVGIYAPEILRHEGELRRRLVSPDTKEIERCLSAALEFARQRTEKSLELRAATSLARFWRDQGDPQKARQVLEPVYGWFTEGLDLPDLKSASALLEELARAVGQA